MTSKSHGNFDLVKSLKLDFVDVTVSKWRSGVTGLSVVHLDYEAPIVNGYLAVRTEIFNDSGCPHTLEHLVFMGSEKYPFKGVLDHLANRGFSNGTNAWTDTDHTVYTVSTAGSQGFLQLLPIYLDHVLYPTLTEAGYVTEVHHIDAKGHDSGVVYSEMQGRQNTAGDLMALRLQQAINPPGSAYRSETGGLMEALRALTCQQIRDYHATYYVPHNLSVIVAGKLTGGSQSLLEVLQKEVEPNIIKHGQNKGPHPPSWKRPFLETPSVHRNPIKESISDTVFFPEKDESVGDLIIAFLGPAPDQYLERKALDILGSYLTSSTVAPLNKEFIETEHPLCTYILLAEEARPTYVDLPIYVGSVPTERLGDFERLLKDSLKRIVREGIDMRRMTMVLNRDERQLRSKLESSKGDVFSTAIIEDFLLSPEDGSLMKPALDEVTYYNNLKTWTPTQWADLLRRYYIDPPSIEIRGQPSAELADRIEKEEKARLAQQAAELGSEGLAARKRILDDAKAEHERPIPTEILKGFPLPDVKSIAWIAVQSQQDHPAKTTNGSINGFKKCNELADHLDKDTTAPPFFVQFDHVQSDFITVHAYLSLDKLPNHLRPLGTIYLSSFFALPVKRASGETLTHEEVVNQLDDESVSYDASLGLNSYFTELLRVSIRVETHKYEAAVRWLKDLIYGSQFTAERLLVNIAKTMQAIPELKRDGNTVMNSFSSNLLYDANSTNRANGVLVQMEQLPIIAKNLEESPNKVIAAFESLRQHLIDPDGIRFSVTGNVRALEKPRSVWKETFGDVITKSLRPVPGSHTTLSPIGRDPKKQAIIVGLATIESSFTIHTAKGIQGFDHPDYPAIRVAVEVLNATESFLWQYIRGSGLAYGASVSMDIESGLTSFSLYRSSNCVGGFNEGAKVVNGLVNGTIGLDDTALDAAKSSIVYSLTKGVSTPGRAAVTSFLNQALKGVSADYLVEMLEKFQAVTKEEVLAALKTYLLPVFDPEQSVAVLVTAPGKIESIKEEFTKIGYNVDEQTIEVSPDEMDVDSEGSDSGSDSAMSDGR